MHSLGSVRMIAPKSSGAGPRCRGLTPGAGFQPEVKAIAGLRGGRPVATSPARRSACQPSGSSSSIRRAGWVLTRSSTSRRQACGSIPGSLHVVHRLINTAAYSASPVTPRRTTSSFDHAELGNRRKSWEFLGSAGAGPRAAVLFTILAGAKQHRREPWEYLRDVLLPLSAGEDDLESMLPDRWATSHPEHVLQHRLDESRRSAARQKEERRTAPARCGRRGEDQRAEGGCPLSREMPAPRRRWVRAAFGE